MRLVNPTDGELNRAFAEKVAGWKRNSFGEWRSPQKQKGIEEFGICTDDIEHPPSFTASADAVLPFTKNLKWKCTTCDGGYVVRILNIGHGEDVCAHPEFATALVVALLRAHGVEVEFTK